MIHTVIKFFCLLGVGLTLSACASTQKYDQMLNSWVGKPETALLKSWGAPSARKINADGSQVITFTQVQDNEHRYASNRKCYRLFLI